MFIVGQFHEKRNLIQYEISDSDSLKISFECC